jgi:hypothetical protein
LPPQLAQWLNRTLKAVQTATDRQILEKYRELQEALIAAPGLCQELHDQGLTGEGLNELRQAPASIIYAITDLMTHRYLDHLAKVLLVDYVLVADQIYIRGL